MGHERKSYGMNNTFIEFLLWYQSAAKTGRLYVSTGEQDGDVFLMEGCAVHAQAGDQFGLQAYLAMLLDWPEPKLMAWEGQTLPRFQSLWLDHFSGMTLLSRFASARETQDGTLAEQVLRRELVLHNRYTISFLVDSPQLGQFTYDVSREFFLVGRAEGNELAIDDHSLSRQHCFISAQEKRLFVHDLNSANGTFIDDHPTYFGVAEEGQKLRFGNVTCTFKILPFRTAEERKEDFRNGKTTIIPREIRQSLRPPQSLAQPILAHAATPTPAASENGHQTGPAKQKKTRPMGLGAA